MLLILPVLSEHAYRLEVASRLFTIVVQHCATHYCDMFWANRICFPGGIPFDNLVFYAPNGTIGAEYAKGYEGRLKPTIGEEHLKLLR